MKLKTLNYLALSAVSLLPLTAAADFLSITIGAGGWDESPSGNLQKTIDTAAVDVENDFFWQSETQGYFFATLEHPVPILPNVRLMYSQLDHSGSGIANFDFDGDTFSGTVSNQFDIETLDLLLYYEVLDNVLSLDLGLNIRNLKADYTITNSSTITDSIDETVPMLYALVGVSPWPDLIISGEINYVTYDGSTVSDLTAKIAYTTDFFLGFEAGYRKQKFEFDDVSDTDANIDFDGVFAGAYLKF